jgi:hypothetical protein
LPIFWKIVALKVDKLQVEIFIKQDIRKLYIAVDDSPGVDANDC